MMRPAGSIVVVLAATMLAAGLSASDVAGQAKSGAAKNRQDRETKWFFENSPIAIKVVSVSAAPAEQLQINDQRFEVPIRIAWETGPWGERVLLELKATLSITDDNGATVDLTKDLGVKDKEDTLVLTLAEGHMPKGYRLTLVGQCRFTGEDGKVRIEPTTAELAGTF